ncbi:hypothetical protein [Chryseobacterium binzhouense]|nr:hypothetical protein [Chryseobacterium binzhouense]
MKDVLRDSEEAQTLLLEGSVSELYFFTFWAVNFSNFLNIRVLTYI